MQPLDRSLRNALEQAILNARKESERGARVALEQLGVGEAGPYEHLSTEDRGLRRRLRELGRHLGDRRNRVAGTQETEKLIEEVGYQHWHRMLFARFLAENGLLMYPDPDYPVPISLDECHELAKEQGATSGWELAGQFAAKMLPQVFRSDSPVYEVKLPQEYQVRLERLVSDLPLAVFKASDSLGWVYQFWQSKRKDEVNASGVKIGARELPAVTQLFTEPYMVSFLLDNALGAWWAMRRLTETDLRSTGDEQELREKASIPGVPLEYLRFVREEDGTWRPAAGTFDKWPQHLSELKVLDPTAGSGHFLVAALLMLTPMRMKLEGLGPQEAIDAILRDNLHGLELDKRCVELAAFAVALTAWRYPGAGGYRTLPDLNIACSGLAVNATKEEWRALAAGKPDVQDALEQLHSLFQDAPVLGSLIDPRQIEEGLFGIDYDEVADLLEDALENGHSEEVHETGVVAHGLARAAALLAKDYHWIITNVPFLTRGKQDEVLRSFCDANYPEAKGDLATVFLERCLRLLGSGGTTSIVLPQNWLFLTSYKRFRQQLLKANTWHLVVRLGAQAFQTPMWDFNVQLLVMGIGSPERDHVLSGLDVSEPRTAEAKAALLSLARIKQVDQGTQLRNPDVAITFESIRLRTLMKTYANSFKGSGTGDDPRFRRRFWELPFTRDWIPLRSAPTDIGFWGLGSSDVLFWQDGKGDLVASPTSYIRNVDQWDKSGLLFSMMGNLSVTLYNGGPWDTTCVAVIPRNVDDSLALWCYAESGSWASDLRAINQKLSVETSHFLNVAFDRDYWLKISRDKYPKGLPRPYSDDPTQWIFHGHPAQSDAPLQVAVARLLGYRWPAELDTEMELSDEAREWIRRSEDLLPFADDDGIVCIPALRGERPAAERLLGLLAAAYGEDWSTDVLSRLLADADYAGKALEEWLRDKFFEQHCRLFLNRPFIWQVWDGLRDGFSALVNYHKLDRKCLESLIYTYLGEWIDRQREAVKRGVDGAEAKLSAAEGLKDRLELILKGEKPYDIFVRWKPLEQQPIGWDPDLNDGVRLNIRPFMMVPDVGRKDAGVLRLKPNIRWTKDRGRDVPSAPWYDEFNGERINDHHLALAVKRQSRS